MASNLSSKDSLVGWGVSSQSKMQQMALPKGRLTRCLVALAVPCCCLAFPVLQNMSELEFQLVYNAISDVTREYSPDIGALEVRHLTTGINWLPGGHTPNRRTVGCPSRTVSRQNEKKRRRRSANPES